MTMIKAKRSHSIIGRSIAEPLIWLRHSLCQSPEQQILDLKRDGAGLDELVESGSAAARRDRVAEPAQLLEVPLVRLAALPQHEPSLPFVSFLKSSTTKASPSQKTSMCSLPRPVFGPSAVYIRVARLPSS